MKTSLLLAFTLLATACWSQEPRSDSRSNWLRECTSERNCGSDLACVCGVCTLPCESEAACGGGDRDAVCIDPAQDGIGARCAREQTADALGICLPACEQDDDCEDDMRCVQGACLAASLAGGDAGGTPSVPVDAGSAGAGGAGTGDAGTIDAGRIDAGTDTTGGNAGSAGVTGTGGTAGTLAPGGPVDAATPPWCDSTLRECCSLARSCANELVCHVDNTCIAAASPDENGVATISAMFPRSDELVAIDDQFAYGLRHQGDPVGSSRLVRWPLAGGDGEVLADGVSFFPWTFPIRVDQDRLYFVAKQSEDDISYSLYSMPKDDSAAPTAHGTAGLWLVDDAEHLYFSNDGGSRVVRLVKATLDTAAAREPVFTSSTDAPDTIMALAINESHVLAIERRRELSPNAFTVRRIDKTSLAATSLGDETKFTVTLLDASDALLLLANDTHLVLLDHDGYVDLLDLTTLEVKPLDHNRQLMLGAVTGDDFYYGWFGGDDDGTGRGVDRLALSTGRRTELLAASGVRYRGPTFGGFGSMVASPDGLFIVTGDEADPTRLLRVVRNP